MLEYSYNGTRPMLRSRSHLWALWRAQHMFFNSAYCYFTRLVRAQVASMSGLSNTLSLRIRARKRSSPGNVNCLRLVADQIWTQDNRAEYARHNSHLQHPGALGSVAARCPRRMKSRKDTGQDGVQWLVASVTLSLSQSGSFCPIRP